MNQLLNLIERVVPRMRYYPGWAQKLFAATFALVLVSFFLWVVVSPTAASNAAHSSIKSSVGLGPADASEGAKGSTRGSSHADVLRFGATSQRTSDALGAPIAYDLDVATQTIAPHVPYLDLVRSGGPLGGIGEVELGFWDPAATFPKLDVKIANTGSKTVFLNSASVHVARSAPDLEPIPVVLLGAAPSPRHFGITNVGWGTMLDTSLDYGVTKGTAPAQAPRLDHHVHLGSIVEQKDVDVSAGTSLLGKTGEATVSGALSYTWRDAAGHRHRQHDRIVTTVYLKRGFPTTGSGAPIQGEYHLDLRVAGRNYDVAVPGFDRFIRPQTPDRFEIKVSAQRSSVHRGVSVRLVYSDGHSTTSSPYTIRIFQPRNSP